MRRLLLAMTLAVGLSLAPAVGNADSAKPSARTYECQHPLTTGAEAFHLRHITPARACTAVRRLYDWELNDHYNDLYGCRFSAGGGSGTPFLKRHHFDGYRLSLLRGFTMTRKKASFSVTGTDFPINCT